MSKAVTAEQREHVRFAPTVLRSDVAWDGERREGYLMNLSLGGALLSLVDPPSPETEITLHILLPWSLGECTVGARCVWAQKDHQGRAVGAGVAFEGLAEEAQEKLRGYLERYAALAAEITT